MPAAFSWPIAHAAFAAPLPKFALNFTCTPPPDLATAEYQNGDTSVSRSAFWTSEVTPPGDEGELIQ